MTELDNAAPAQAETAVATSDAVTNGSQNTAPATDWISALDEETRNSAVAKGWKTPADPAKAYLHSQREFQDLKSKALVLPSPDAKPEDWSAFYSKLGRPEAPTGYEFKLPDGLPENMPYDSKAAEKFRQWAFDAGLPPKQAQALHDQYVKDTAAQMEAYAEAQVKQMAQAHETLTKAWGDKSSDSYKRNQELANRAIRQQGGSELVDELKSIGVLSPDGDVKTPRLAMALAKVGESLYAEDTMYGGPVSVENPFLENVPDFMKKQGVLISNDPERAKVLIRLAGQDPARWGFKA